MNNYQLARTRLAFICHVLGLTVQDEEKCIKIMLDYGYREVFGQYIDHYLVGDTFNPFTHEGQLKRPTTFEEIYDLYHFDQQLKNQLMIALQLFEQTFKCALTPVVELKITKQRMAQIKAGEPPFPEELLNEHYQLQSGRIIRRGDVKARIRHISKNFLEPIPGYTKMHGGITPWVLFKEMSFGVVTNFFFLMQPKMQQQVLGEVFKEDLNLRLFEQYLALIDSFRHRAAHNYRLLGIRVRGHFLYPNVIAALSLLKNQEPYQKAKRAVKQVSQQYLQQHPEEKSYLQKVL